MKGRTVELVPISEDEDFVLLVKWAVSGGKTYASGAPEFGTPEEAKAAFRNGSMNNTLLIQTPEGRKVGIVTWHQLTYPGNYEIGVFVADSSLWGHGHGVDALLLLMEMLFHALNAHRVQAIIGAYNRPMMELVTRGPFQIEGVLRDYLFLDGEYHDGVVSSMLRREYYNPGNEDVLLPRDVIPASDKQEARRLLSKYLADHPLGTPTGTE